MLFPGIYKKNKTHHHPTLNSWNSTARSWHPKAGRAQLGSGCGKLKVTEDGHREKGRIAVCSAASPSVQ